VSTEGRFQGCGFVLALIAVGFAVCLALVAVANTLAPSGGGSLGRNDRASGRSDGSYTVRPGDTLSGIADRHRTTVSALARANRLANADQIKVGQRLRLAGGTPEPVQEARAKEPPARPEVSQPEIRRSENDPCRYYFVSLSELDEQRLSVLTRQDCPTYGTSYERIELNCRSAEFRYIGDAREVAGIVSRPSKWTDFLAGSAKNDTATFACAKAGRTLGNNRSPEPVLPKAPSDAELHTLFMDCSAVVSVL